MQVKNYLLFFFILIFALACGGTLTGPGPAPIRVLIESGSGAPGQQITLSLSALDNLSGKKVKFFSTAVTYTDSVLIADSVSSVSTLSEKWGPIAHDVSVPGEIIASHGGEAPLEGRGTLANIFFSVVGQPGDTAIVRFAGFIFNTGIPASTTEGGDGFFTVTAKIEITAQGVEVVVIEVEYGQKQN